MNKREKLLYLIKYLLSEDKRYKNILVPESEEERFKLFRSLVNVRSPKSVSEEFLTVQDDFLQSEIAEKGISDIADMQPISGKIYLWKGDITTLKCGAIVNAANSQMQGCFQPCHSCIDNAIHTFSGVQLRLKCAEIMREQGHDEPTGTAKITPAYNLPCGSIIHTVGPTVSGKLTEVHCIQLENCYKACLGIAAKNNIKSVALCCISTGVFGFPQEPAAEIAVRTVREFLKKNNTEVIFNVFRQDDFEIYDKLLR